MEVTGGESRPILMTEGLACVSLSPQAAIVNHLWEEECGGRLRNRGEAKAGGAARPRREGAIQHGTLGSVSVNNGR